MIWKSMKKRKVSCGQFFLKGFNANNVIVSSIEEKNWLPIFFLSVSSVNGFG